jgi:hypothetical protein
VSVRSLRGRSSPRPRLRRRLRPTRRANGARPPRRPNNRAPSPPKGPGRRERTGASAFRQRPWRLRPRSPRPPRRSGGESRRLRKTPRLRPVSNAAASSRLRCLHSSPRFSVAANGRTSRRLRRHSSPKSSAAANGRRIRRRLAKPGPRRPGAPRLPRRRRPLRTRIARRSSEAGRPRRRRRPRRMTRRTRKTRRTNGKESRTKLAVLPDRKAPATWRAFHLYNLLRNNELDSQRKLTFLYRFNMLGSSRSLGRTHEH